MNDCPVMQTVVSSCLNRALHISDGIIQLIMAHQRDLAHHMDGENQNDQFFKLLNDASVGMLLAIDCKGSVLRRAGDLELVQRGV